MLKIFYKQVISTLFILYYFMNAQKTTTIVGKYSFFMFAWYSLNADVVLHIDSRISVNITILMS